MGTDMKASVRITEIANEIEALLRANPLPAPNPAVLQRLQFLCGQIAGHSHYSSEKVGQIIAHATKYYSARKHHSVHGGAEMLMTLMTFDLLSRIRSDANSFAAQGQ